MSEDLESLLKKLFTSVMFVGKARSLPKGGKPGAYVIKLITAVIYGFRFKLECLSLNTRLGLPATSTLAYNRNRKLWL